jgi:hypothetical protein
MEGGYFGVVQEHQNTPKDSGLIGLVTNNWFKFIAYIGVPDTDFWVQLNNNQVKEFQDAIIRYSKRIQYLWMDQTTWDFIADPQAVLESILDAQIPELRVHGNLVSSRRFTKPESQLSIQRVSLASAIMSMKHLTGLNLTIAFSFRKDRPPIPVEIIPDIVQSLPLLVKFACDLWITEEVLDKLVDVLPGVSNLEMLSLNLSDCKSLEYLFLTLSQLSSLCTLQFENFPSTVDNAAS